jgi:hypothetical protein
VLRDLIVLGLALAVTILTALILAKVAPKWLDTPPPPTTTTTDYRTADTGPLQDHIETGVPGRVAVFRDAPVGGRLEPLAARVTDDG